MRAKERNLQALRHNYKKMQEISIAKLKKLERAVANARSRTGIIIEKRGS